MLTSQMAHQARVYHSFCNMKQLGVFLTPGWQASPSKVPPGTKYTGTHSKTWVKRGTVRVKCLVQEQNTMSLILIQLLSILLSCLTYLIYKKKGINKAVVVGQGSNLDHLIGVKCANHETTVPPQCRVQKKGAY